MDSTMIPGGRLGVRKITARPHPQTIRRIKLPGLPTIAWAFDGGEALTPGALLFPTNLAMDVVRNGEIVEHRDLGSGVITIGFVNALVSDAVAANTNNDLALFKYMDCGIGTTAATDGDTALQTAITSGPARVAATLTNAQTATTGNHTAKLQYQATTTFGAGPTYPVAVTEWALFNASSSGTMMDHRIFSAVNVSNGDGISWTYTLSLASNG